MKFLVVLSTFPAYNHLGLRFYLDRDHSWTVNRDKAHRYDYKYRAEDACHLMYPEVCTRGKLQIEGSES